MPNRIISLPHLFAVLLSLSLLLNAGVSLSQEGDPPFQSIWTDGLGVSNSAVESFSGTLDVANVDGTGHYIVGTIDVTGDGFADLVSCHTDGSAFVWPGRPDGSFGTARSSFNGSLNFGNLDQTGHYIVGLADVNGDGRADLVSTHPNGRAYVWPGRADGAFGGAVSSFNGTLDMANYDGQGHYILGVADVTGDGKSDLISSHNNGHAYVWPGRANGTFGGARSSFNGTLNIANQDGSGHYIVGLGDVDGDGHADLVSAHTNQNAYVWPGREDGSFGGAVSSFSGTLDFANLDQTGHLIIGIADTNGDGKADLVSSHTDGHAYVWPGGSDRQFGQATKHYRGQLDAANQDGSGHFIVGMGDINGDGDAELSTAHENGTAYVWTFSAGVSADAEEDVEQTGRMQPWIIDDSTVFSRTGGNLHCGQNHSTVSIGYSSTTNSDTQFIPGRRAAVGYCHTCGYRNGCRVYVLVDNPSAIQLDGMTRVSAVDTLALNTHFNSPLGHWWHYVVPQGNSVREFFIEPIRQGQSNVYSLIVDVNGYYTRPLTRDYDVKVVQPVLRVSHNRISIDDQRHGETAVREFTIRNAGTGTLFTQIPNTVGDFRVMNGGGSVQIEAGRTHRVRVEITLGASATRGTLRIQSNVGDHSVDLTATPVFDPPRLSVSSTVVDFGVTPGHTAVIRELQIRNLGELQLRGSIRLSTASEALAFRVGDSFFDLNNQVRGFELNDSDLTLAIRYTATDDIDVNLLIETNGGNVSIPLRGQKGPGAEIALSGDLDSGSGSEALIRWDDVSPRLAQESHGGFITQENAEAMADTHRTLTIGNSGVIPLSLDAQPLPAPFVGSIPAMQLNPGESQDVTIQCLPTANGDFLQEVILTGNTDPTVLELNCRSRVHFNVRGDRRTCNLSGCAGVSSVLERHDTVYFGDFYPSSRPAETTLVIENPAYNTEPVTVQVMPPVDPFKTQGTRSLYDVVMHTVMPGETQAVVFEVRSRQVASYDSSFAIHCVSANHAPCGDHLALVLEATFLPRPSFHAEFIPQDASGFGDGIEGAVSFRDSRIGKLRMGTLRLQNTGEEATLMHVEIELDGGQAFSLDNHAPGSRIPLHGQTEVNIPIRFNPPASGQFTGSLRILHDVSSTGPSDEVRLRATWPVTGVGTTFAVPHIPPFGHLHEPLARNQVINETYHALDLALADYIGGPYISNWYTFGKYASREVGDTLAIFEEGLSYAQDLAQFLDVPLNTPEQEELNYLQIGDVLRELLSKPVYLRQMLMVSFASAGLDQASIDSIMSELPADGTMPGRLFFVRLVAQLDQLVVAMPRFLTAANRVYVTLENGNRAIAENVAPAAERFLQLANQSPSGIPVGLNFAGDPRGFLAAAFERYAMAREMRIASENESDPVRSESLMRQRDEAVHEGNLLLGIQEQLVILQPLFDQIETELTAIDGTMSIHDPLGSFGLRAGWVDFYTRMGIDTCCAPADPASIMPALLPSLMQVGDPRFEGTIGEYFTIRLYQNEMRRPPSEINPLN